MASAGARMRAPRPGPASGILRRRNENGTDAPAEAPDAGKKTKGMEETMAETNLTEMTKKTKKATAKKAIAAAIAAAILATAATGAEAQDLAAPAAGAEAQAELREGEFALGGERHDLPFAYEDVEENWRAVGTEPYDDGKLIPIGGGVAFETAMTPTDGGGGSFAARFSNLGKEPAAAPEASVVAVRAPIWRMEDGEWAEAYPPISLKGGVTWGSTREEVTEAFGEPAQAYVEGDGGAETLEYSFEDGTALSLTVDPEEGVLAISMADMDAD